MGIQKYLWESLALREEKEEKSKLNQRNKVFIFLIRPLFIIFFILQLSHNTSPIILFYMLFIIIPLLLLLFLTQQQLTNSASLFILSFSPPILNLTFSESTPQPKFQLLFNNINISYSIKSNEIAESSFYQIQAELDNVNPQQFNIELYTLIFSEPLSILGGNLQLNDYVLEGERQLTESEYLLTPFEQKDQLYFYQSENEALNIMAILIVTFTYLASLIDIGGIWMIQFLQVFAFFQLHSQFYTYFDYKIAYYLLFQPHQFFNQLLGFIYLCIPFLLILLSLCLGLIARFCFQLRSKQSWKWRIVQRYFAYKFFIIVWRIMIFPIFANTFHLIMDPDHFISVGSYVYVYFGFVTTISFFYFGFMVINPQCSQNQISWEEKTKSVHFSFFQSLYKGLYLNTWSKRNANMFIVMGKLIICFFITMLNSLIPTLIAETFKLFCFFTVRPFSLSFYTTASIRMQILIVIFYLYLSLVNLYFGMSAYINTSTGITICMIITIVICCLIVVLFGLWSGVQFYGKIKSIKRLVEMQMHKKKEEQINRRKFSKDEIFQQEKMRKKQRKKSIISGIMEDQKIRIRNKTMIREKEKKQIQKESLLQNVAHKQ